jgi:osmotically-inducible protein OsmY
MKTNKLVIGVCTIFAAAAIGCQTANNNMNGNANLTAANANANTNANRNVNANPPLNANISRAEYEQDKETWAEEARRLGRTIATGVNDGWLWTKTRALLASENELRDSTIEVDVENGVITLSGSVATDQQKTTAGRIAQGVDGVESVRNNLAVKANANS